MKFQVIGSVILAFGPTSVSSAPVVNGDFSQGAFGFTSDYQLTATNTTEGQYTVASDPSLFNARAIRFGDHTSGNGLMLLVNGAVSPGKTFWQQTVSLEAGRVYEFSGWYASWGNNGSGRDPSPASIAIFADGVRLPGEFTVSPINGLWSHFSASWISSVTGQSSLRLVDLNTAFSGNDLALDDLSVTPIPEPSSLTLLLLGFPALFAYSRRNRSGACLHPRFINS